MVRKTVPTTRKLIPALREKIGWQWSERSLRRVLHDMGFVWKKCKNKREFLIEWSDIVMWRSKYLTEVRKLRREGKEIFYLDESWLDTNLTVDKCWQKEGDVKGILKWGSASNRLIVVHIGSENGFLENGVLVFKAGNSTGDYHGQMNSENFEKWLKERVLPNLAPSSVIVMDNAPYHSKQADKCPSQYATKGEIVAWLKRKGVECDITDRKYVLIELLLKHKPTEKKYVVDKLFQDHGHQVLRLPPYMCDLNPIELAWAKIKKYICEHNTAGEISLQALQTLTTEAVNNVTRDDWTGYVKHVIDTEDYYWKKDYIMETAMDQFVINTGDSSSDEECMSYGSDVDTDDGSPLAVPL